MDHKAKEPPAPKITNWESWRAWQVQQTPTFEALVRNKVDIFSALATEQSPTELRSRTIKDELVTAFLDGLGMLKSPWHVAEFIGMSIVYWGVNGIGIYLFAIGFGLDIPVVAAYAMLSLVVVGMLIPNSPGNVGSFWYFLLLPAGLYGINPDAPRTIAFALALWLMQTVQVTVFAAWGWWADARVQRKLAR